MLCFWGATILVEVNRDPRRYRGRYLVAINPIKKKVSAREGFVLGKSADGAAGQCDVR